MKKRIQRLCVCLLALCALCLIACENSDYGAADGSDLPADTPYVLEFTSNGDGTCYVSAIITNPSYRSAFVVEIPEISPDGDSVTAVRCGTFASNLPAMLTEADFAEIQAALEQRVNEGKMDAFFKAKLESYFARQALESKTTLQAKEDLIAKYPITEHVNIYVLAEDLTAAEKRFVAATLFENAGYTASDCTADLQNLRNTAPNEEILATLPQLPEVVRSGEYITEIQLPSSVTEIDLSLYSSCIGLEKLDLPSCITSIGENAFAYTPLKTVTLPAALTEIGACAFSGCDALTSVTFADAADWHVTEIVPETGEHRIDETVSVADPAQNAEALSKTYCDATWSR